MATCIPYAREACRSGLESGDFLYAAYGAATEAWPAMVATQDLAQFVRDYSLESGADQEAEGGPRLPTRPRSSSTGRGRCRAGPGRRSRCRTRGSTRASTWRRIAATRSSPPFMPSLKLQLCYLFGEFGQALEAARNARVAHQLSGTIWPVEFDFWNGLTLAANYANAAEEERADYLAEMEEARRSLGILAENCPENFRCQWLLLSAEIERISGRSLAALDRYEQAIGYAESTAMLQHQALANELCARFWLERSQADVAAVFLAAARRAYARWGATAKVVGPRASLRRSGRARGARQPAPGRHRGIHDPGGGDQYRPRHRHEGGPRAGRRDGAGAAAGEAAGDRDRERRSRAGRAGAGARRGAAGACPGVGGPGRGAGPRRPAAGGDRRAAGRHRELRPADPGKPGARGRAER